MSALVERLLAEARRAGLMVATAESCTGGLLAGAITDVAGSSAVLDRGFVTYSNAAKQEMLGVDAATLSRFGAVSEETAREMARGALARSHAGVAVAVTGIAGPGGSDLKPEGRVCFATAHGAEVASCTFEFGATGRGSVRAAAVVFALERLLEVLAVLPDAERDA